MLFLVYVFSPWGDVVIGSFGAGKWGEISSSQSVIMHTIYLRLIFDWIKEFQPRPVDLCLGPIFWPVLSLSRLRLGSRLILGSGFWFLLASGLPPSIVTRGPYSFLSACHFGHSFLSGLRFVSIIKCLRTILFARVYSALKPFVSWPALLATWFFLQLFLRNWNSLPLCDAHCFFL